MLNAWQPSQILLGSDVCQRRLTLDCTLEELFLYEFEIETCERGRKVSLAFEANPLLPGVILTEQGLFVGMISRRRFLEYMSRPFALPVFSKRALKDLYQFVSTEILILPGNISILAAAKQSLQRSPALLYEPIVVEIKPQVYRLLDVHQLLIAQSNIHELATEIIGKLNTKLEQANHELKRLATIDSLTQTPNRRHFDEYLALKWRQLAREQAFLSLILCDIDFFKRYNDTYGHLAGDECLQQVAGALKSAVKRPADLVARYGGEEFAIILPDTNMSGAVRVAEQMRASVGELKIPHRKSTVSSQITLSLGVASVVPYLETSPEMLIAAADEALYQAKAAGRDRYILYSDG